mmetsp:Transcript_154538/g.284802  ORF Transcript_154538/g.284802 Transcript_154538/m.284802 type:complete len:938 (-) Transcript_154538:37-2850(-)
MASSSCHGTNGTTEVQKPISNGHIPRRRSGQEARICVRTDLKITTLPIDHISPGVAQNIGMESSQTEKQARQSPTLAAEAKDDAAQQLIKTCLRENRMCKTLEESDLAAIVKAMERFCFDKGDVVFKQGSVGNYFFVVNSGSFEVNMAGKVVNTLHVGSAFGELAIMYGCTRTATVTATEPATAWGVHCDIFRHVLHERMKKYISENMKCVDSIWMFKLLGSRQRELLCEAVNMETAEAGDRVLTEGEQVTGMYYVKSGSLRCVKGGTVDSTGAFSGGEKVAELEEGSIFGEWGILYNAPRASTVIANTKCELLCFTVQKLKEVFGNNLSQSLERQIILARLERSPIFSEFSHAQKSTVAQAMLVKEYGPREAIKDTFWLFIVIGGEITAMLGGNPVRFGRGDWYEQVSAGEGESQALCDITVGADGARIQMLTGDIFAQALKQLHGSSAQQASLWVRKMLLVKKVPIFRHLSQEQTHSLVRALVLTVYRKGQTVLTQGDIGTTFYVVASGEVVVKIDGNVVRTLGKNAFFGERALLFEEPRTATVEVASDEMQVWSLEKVACHEIMEGKMFEELVHRIRLQDTKVSLKDLKHIKVIGTGGFGVVRLVEHRWTGMRYALKRCRKEKGKIPVEIKQECDRLAENDHPFIMHTVKTFETERSIYILTELITGGDLYAAIREIPQALDRQQAQFYTGSLILVLDQLCSRNIVYRDLKPENVMLDIQGYIKLIDFGIAKKLSTGNPRTFTVIGTPHYMAPEVIRRTTGYGTQVDIWSAGVMLYEFVAGGLPFAEGTDKPNQICAAVLNGIVEFPKFYKDEPGRSLISAMLTKEPDKRIGSGVDGYEEIMVHPFFKIGKDEGTTTLFDMIMGRQLEPPWVPNCETYCVESGNEEVLSDVDELFKGTDSTLRQFLAMMQSCVCTRSNLVPALPSDTTCDKGSN